MIDNSDLDVRRFLEARNVLRADDILERVDTR